MDQFLYSVFLLYLSTQSAYFMSVLQVKGITLKLFEGIL